LCSVHHELNLQLDDNKTYQWWYQKLENTKNHQIQKSCKHVSVGKNALKKDNKKQLRYLGRMSGPFDKDQELNRKEFTYHKEEGKKE